MHQHHQFGQKKWDGDWVPKGECVSIFGHNLSGLIYVGTPPELRVHGSLQRSRAYIDPSLPVGGARKDKEGKELPFWPCYSDISPICRATYLEWLADGARDNSYSPGYMFLYFYGLERRFFVDRIRMDEARTILAEVRRLSILFKENGSVQRYLGEFIELAVVATVHVDSIEPVFDAPGWGLPFSVKFAIGAKINKEQNLTADWLLSWFLCHPDRSLKVVVKRCRDEFIALFRLRFAARFPRGLQISRPRKSLHVRYEAASKEFSGSVRPRLNGKNIPDISGLRQPVEIAQEIADEAMDDLDKFSRYLGRNPDGRGSVEAHALLPLELWKLFPSREVEQIRNWASEKVAQGGMASVSEVIVRLEGHRPQRIRKRQLIGAADALARVGFGLAPDPRFALRSPRIDEPVILFNLGVSVERLENTSTMYKTALMELALASFIVHADGVVSDVERRALFDQQASYSGMTDQEQRRLHANVEWFLTVPPDLNLIRRKLKEAGADKQSAIRAALVSAAHADGVVHPDEVAEIEKIYRALGINTSLVYSDLHARDFNDAPQKVREAVPSIPGEAIPREVSGSIPELDRARIAHIRRDTDRVSNVLADIFTQDLDESEVPDVSASSVLAGLDDKHSELVRDIISRQHWGVEEFGDLARRRGLMVAGALETVNEWAFEAYDEALLDEYNGYHVSQDLAEALADEFEKER